MKKYTLRDVAMLYPPVDKNQPEWKRTCPFCGAVDTVHDVDKECFVCHECHANWLEHDTETERQIQILNLNGAPMPRFNYGEMPIRQRTFIEKFEYIAMLDLDTNIVTFFDGGHDDDKRASSF